MHSFLALILTAPAALAFGSFDTDHAVNAIMNQVDRHLDTVVDDSAEHLYWNLVTQHPSMDLDPEEVRDAVKPLKHQIMQEYRPMARYVFATESQAATFGQSLEFSSLLKRADTEIEEEVGPSAKADAASGSAAAHEHPAPASAAEPAKGGRFQKAWANTRTRVSAMTNSIKTRLINAWKAVVSALRLDKLYEKIKQWFEVRVRV